MRNVMILQHSDKEAERPLLFEMEKDASTKIKVVINLTSKWDRSDQDMPEIALSKAIDFP